MYSHVQTTGNAFASSAAGRAIAYVNPTTSGNTLVVCAIAFVGSGSVTPTFTITDDQGNSANYVSAVNINGQASSAGSRIVAAIYVCPNCTGGASHTVTVTPSIACFVSFGISEFTAGNPSPLDGSNGIIATANTAVTTNSIPVSQNNELIVAVMSTDGTTTTITPDAAYAEAFEIESATNSPIAIQYDLDADSAQAATWTLGVAKFNISAGAGFKELITDVFKYHFLPRSGPTRYFGRRPSRERS